MGWRVMYPVMDTFIKDDTTKRKPKQSGEPKQHAIAKVVLLSLARHAHDDGSHARPSRETIASETGLCLRTVATGLEWLETHAYITPTAYDGSGGCGRAVEYCINLDMLTSRNVPYVPSPQSTTAVQARPQNNAADAHFRSENRASHAENRASHAENRAGDAPQSGRIVLNQNTILPERERADVRRAGGAPPAALAARAEGQRPATADRVRGIVVDGEVGSVVDADSGRAVDIEDVRRGYAHDEQVLAALRWPTWLERQGALGELYAERYDRRRQRMPPEQRRAEIDADERDEAAWEAYIQPQENAARREYGDDYAERFYSDASEQHDLTVMCPRHDAVGVPYVQIRHWLLLAQQQPQPQPQLHECEEETA